MKKYLIYFLLLYLLLSCSTKEQNAGIEQVKENLSKLQTCENYFKLKNYYEKNKHSLAKKDKIYYKAILLNAFNEHKSSNEDIRFLLEGNLEILSNSELLLLHKTKYMNHQNLFEYAEALKECELMLSDYKELMDSVKYVQLKNDQKILKALKNAPAQRVIKTSDSHVKIYKDRFGLININLLAARDSFNLIFDTGSSFSFMRRSLAEKLGGEIFDIDIEVEGATGYPVICDLTMIPEFSFGNISIFNPVFWVFEDKDLTIPEYNYSLNGVIGFPIIRGLEEIELKFWDELFIPEVARKYEYNNLAMDDLDPIVEILNDGDSIPFYFDTGAAFSSFYKPFYAAHAAKIDTTYDQHLFNIGSIGGVKEFSAYIIDSIQLGVANKSAWVYDIETHTASIYKDEEKVFGNLGQDFLLQFEKMIISIKYSSLLFE